jgi:ABC-type uncharacterized transport system fused permease/ATPase subunit
MQGCQIFLGTIYLNKKKYSNNHKIYQMAIRYTTWLKMFRMAVKWCSFPRPLNICQNVIWGMKIYLRATMTLHRFYIPTKMKYNQIIM